MTKLPTSSTLAGFNPAPMLFGRVNTLTFEKGTPKNKLSANMNWKLGQWGATARATRYGEAISPGTTPALDFDAGGQDAGRPGSALSPCRSR